MSAARILVVEDEQAVRGLVRQLLELAGYDVIEAVSAEAALDLDVAEVDVLLTDVVMPGISGPEVAARLLERNPHLKILFVSGYTDDLVLRDGISSGTTAFLQKPFTAKELAAKVEAVLEAPAVALP